MKNFKKISAMTAVVLATGLVTATAVAAGPYYNANESQTLVSSGYTTNSRGQFDFSDGAAYFDAADINNLAAAVNDCFTSASNGKKAVADGLMNVGTYFTGEGTNDYTNNATAQQKSITYNNGASAISNSENSDFINTDNIPFSTLMDAVSHSQDIPDDIKQTQATNEAGEYLYFEDETASFTRDLTRVSTTNTGYPVYYGEVKPENLSAGSAAWVNGELILGTGADNNAYYQLGENLLNMQLYFTKTTAMTQDTWSLSCDLECNSKFLVIFLSTTDRTTSGLLTCEDTPSKTQVVIKEATYKVQIANKATGNIFYIETGDTPGRVQLRHIKPANGGWFIGGGLVVYKL